MLRITKGVVVFLSLGGLVYQFDSLHSELSNSPKEQQLMSFDDNSYSMNTYLGLSKYLKVTDFSKNLPSTENSDLRPKLVCPHDIAGLDCGDDLPEPFTTIEDFLEEGGYHEEFCEGEFSISSSELGNPEDLNHCSEVYSLFRRRYTITDACGYSKSCIQRIVYNVDNTPPTVDCSVLSDVSVDCDNQDLQDQLEDWLSLSSSALLAASSDNCSENSVTHDYDIDADDIKCQDSEGTIITFSISDACGHKTQCDASIHVALPKPEIGQPHDKAGLSCGTTLPPAATNLEEFLAIGGSVDEHCGKGLTISHKDIGDVASMDYCSDRPIIVRRRYTVVDGCGKSTSTIQRFEFVKDTEAPNIDCGDMNNFVVNCDKSLLEGDIQDWISSMEDKIMKSASDNCGAMTIDHNYTSNAAADMDCVDGAQMSVSFTVSDACGNSSSCTASIVSAETGEQTEPTVPRPEVECVHDIENIACGEEVPVPVSTLEQFRAAQGEIIQFCEGELSITSQDIGSADNIDICSSSKNVLRRRYIIRDECGNEKRCLQRITFQQDFQAPTVNCDLTNDLIVNCDNEVSEEDMNLWLDQVHADLQAASVDDCSNLDINDDYEEGKVNDLNCGNQNELLVTFVIADECGNATSCSASIIKEDTGSAGLILGNRNDTGNSSVLYQNSPNPFAESTAIKFNLKESGLVRFTIYDMSGKLLLERSKEHSEGANTINITRDMLNNISGIVFYAIEVKGYKEVKSMIILE